jgi:hypothetical protein
MFRGTGRKMKVNKLNSWEDFEGVVSLIDADLEKRRKETGLHVSPILFRGQSKESWRDKIE